MGWLVFVLTIMYLAHRTFSTSKPRRTSSFAPSAPSPLKYNSASKSTFEQEVNTLISGMRCYRCNTGEVPSYKKEPDTERINCCCEPFLAEITAQIESYFSTNQVACKIHYLGKTPDRTATFKQPKEPVQPLEKKPPSEPEILITYVDAEGRETTRKISDLRYSTSYYFKAYCHLRDDERHFCPERIKQAVDLKTGEVLETIIVKWGDKGKTRKFTDIGWE